MSNNVQKVSANKNAEETVANGDEDDETQQIKERPI